MLEGKIPAFGLDLSDLSLKIVQFKEKKNKLSLNGYAKKDLPVGLVGEGKIKKEKELAEILKEVLAKPEKGSLEGRRVVCNLPEEKVFIRMIQMPPMKESEVDEAVKWEAETHIPLKIDEVYLAWQKIKPISGNFDHLDILIAASPRVLVDRYVSFLKKSGLEPIALEPESVAVVRSLINPDDLKPTIIVDLGMTGTNFVIYSAGAIRFTSHIDISGQLFSQVIIKELSVEEPEANRLKIEIGLDETKEKGKIYQALEPVVSDLAKQIKDYISFYHNHASHIHGPNGTIAQVLLCGGDSLLLNLPQYLNQKLNLPVRTGNSLVNIPSLLPTKKKETPRQSPLSPKGSLTYATALGLALNEVKSWGLKVKNFKNAQTQPSSASRKKEN